MNRLLIALFLSLILSGCFKEDTPEVVDEQPDATEEEDVIEEEPYVPPQPPVDPDEEKPTETFGYTYWVCHHLIQGSRDFKAHRDNIKAFDPGQNFPVQYVITTERGKQIIVSQLEVENEYSCEFKN